MGAMKLNKTTLSLTSLGIIIHRCVRKSYQMTPNPIMPMCHVTGAYPIGAPYTWMKMAYSDKHSSLLRQGSKYDCKFFSTGS